MIRNVEINFGESFCLSKKCKLLGKYKSTSVELLSLLLNVAVWLATILVISRSNP